MTCRSFSHFDALDLDTPWIGAFVQVTLHAVRDDLPIGENLLERFRAENVSQCCLSEQLGRILGIFHIGHTNYLAERERARRRRSSHCFKDIYRVEHPTVDDGIDGNSHRITC